MLILRYEILYLVPLSSLKMLVLVNILVLVHGIGFGAGGSFSLSDASGFGKKVNMFVVNMSSSIHNDNKTKTS